MSLHQTDGVARAETDGLTDPFDVERRVNTRSHADAAVLRLLLEDLRADVDADLACLCIASPVIAPEGMRYHSHPAFAQIDLPISLVLASARVVVM